MDWRVSLFSWSLLVFAVGHGFAQFDFGWGLLRGGSLIACMVVGLSLARARRSSVTPLVLPRAARQAVALFVVLSLAYHAYAAADWNRRTHEADIIKLDQGQTLYRALRHFPEVNPYARGVLLDPKYYIQLIQRHYHSGCLHFPVEPPAREAPASEHERWRRQMLQLATRLWWQDDLHAAQQLMPRVESRLACADAALGFDSLGFKYGPLTLATFAPGVALFGKVGVFVTQDLLFALICGLVWLAARVRAGAHTGVHWLALALLLSVPMLRDNLLRTSALDGTATVLCLAALWLWLRGHGAVVAMLLGCAVGAKLLPTLLYLPLLLTLPRRCWLLFAACAITPYLPFLVWDARGLFDNVVMFPLTRGGNTTSLAFYLPAWARPLHAAAFAVVMLGFLARAARARFAVRPFMDYLLVAHMALLAGSQILHNNYSVWFGPLLALFVVELTPAPERRVGHRSGDPNCEGGAALQSHVGRASSP
ncbi:MAG: hypothetical protein OEZ06_24495 [Myxococcales bacterium]|nr:hypothetical protein [Myxococcales bacterium]